MANLKITSLTALGAAPATNDLVPIVDTSDTTDAATGTTKKITVANLFTTPTIGDMTNAQHNHENAAGGGQLDSDALSGAVSIAKGGTGQTTNTAAFDALAPTTTQGDIIYHNGSDNIRLAKGTAGKVLTMNAGATAPEWAGAYASGVITRDLTAVSAAVTTAHGLGVIPKRIKITSFNGSTDTVDGIHCSSVGTYDGTTIASAQAMSNVGQAGVFNTSTVYIVLAGETVAVSQTAVPTFDATNITLTWTKNGSPTSSAAILWEAWT